MYTHNRTSVKSGHIVSQIVCIRFRFRWYTRWTKYSNPATDSVLNFPAPNCRSVKENYWTPLPKLDVWACFPPVSAYVWFHTSLVFRCSWSCPLLSLGFMSMSLVHLPIHTSSVFLTFSLQTLLQIFEITRRNYSVPASPYSLHPVMSFWD